VDLHCGAGNKLFYRLDNLAPPAAIRLSYHPDKFAEDGQRDRNELGRPQQFAGEFLLLGIVADRSTHQNVGIDGDPQSSPAQPFSIISFISSIVSGFVPGRFRSPMKFSIEPAGSAARNSSRPFGSRSTSIF